MEADLASGMDRNLAHVTLRIVIVVRIELSSVGKAATNFRENSRENFLVGPKLYPSLASHSQE